MWQDIKPIWIVWAVLTVMAGVLTLVTGQLEPFLGALFVGLIVGFIHILAWLLER